MNLTLFPLAESRREATLFPKTMVFQRDRATEIAQLRAENSRLREEQLLRKLQDEHRDLINQATQRRSDAATSRQTSFFQATPVDSSRAGSVLDQQVDPPTFTTSNTPEPKPKNMPPYRGQSTGEHYRWFREVETRFHLSPKFFAEESRRVWLCMQFLEGDPDSQWYQHKKEQEEAGENPMIFKEFRTFLLDLVENPVNREQDAWTKWENAHQRPENQTPSQFKAYLDELEEHLEPLPEAMKARIFLAKLKPTLKFEIQKLQNIPKTRGGIAALGDKLEHVNRATGGARSGLSNKSRGSQDRNSNATNHSRGLGGGKPQDNRSSHQNTSK